MKDSEIVHLYEINKTYFKREVQQNVADAWIETTKQILDLLQGVHS